MKERVTSLGLRLAPIMGVCIGFSGSALAQAPDASRFPSKSNRLIVPFPPGGSNDILGRFIAQKLTERLGQQTIVDNRAGADGIIGSEVASRAPADGHTLLMISTSCTMNPAIHKMPFDPVKSFTPIAQIAIGPNVISSHPTFPAHNVKELIALARKSKPGDIRYATSGIGGVNHFHGELFNQTAKVKLAHIPYKGGGPAMVDVMTGQVEIVFGTLIQALPHLRSGRLKPLGVGSANRSPLLPQVQSISETVPGYDGTIWWGLLGPAGVPAPIVTRLNNEINAILREPDMAKRLTAEAAEPVVTAPDAFGKLIADNIAKWGRIARDSGIKAE